MREVRLTGATGDTSSCTVGPFRRLDVRSVVRFFLQVFIFCLIEIRAANGDVQECRSSPEAESHRV